MERHQIHYGNKCIDFMLERKNVKNVNLNIKPDMTIQVSANDQVPIDFIYEFDHFRLASNFSSAEGNFKKINTEASFE